MTLKECRTEGMIVLTSQHPGDESWNASADFVPSCGVVRTLLKSQSIIPFNSVTRNAPPYRYRNMGWSRITQGSIELSAVQKIENKWEMGLPAIVNGINNGINSGITTGNSGMVGILVPITTPK
ncbi:hypothetical protein DFH06DRAFT_1120580 [Mycena polygramma]|nr:hypothetical protein DFH06DRAFT_1120580 [Mycena polygramma]